MSGRHLTPDELREVRSCIRLYEALATDLRAIVSGGWPSPDALPDAPVLDDWRLCLTPVTCIHGDVSGHPLLDDQVIETSPIIAMPKGNRTDVVRTQSRWYRLGARRASQ